LDITSIVQTGDDATIIQAVEMIGNDAVVLGSIPVTGKGAYRISFKPTGSSVQLSVLGAYDILLKPTCYTYPVTTQETYLVDICDENKDRYRFGFNGMEKDNELKGIGNSYDFTFRAYDSRLGRFMGIDPLFKQFPWNSAYAFAENRVIDGVDLEGGEFKYSTLDPLAGIRSANFTMDVMKGIVKTAAAGLGVITEVIGDVHYGNRMTEENHKKHFPQTHGKNNAVLVKETFKAPFYTLQRLIEDPTNGENWGEAIFVGMTLRSGAKSFKEGIVRRMPTLLEKE